MLSGLSIRNLALLQEADLEFSSGLNILSGETGSGKSILLEGLALVLGGRGSIDLIRSGEDQAEVSATFETSNPALSDWLSRQGFGSGDSDSEILIRRILQKNSKNRIWINDKPASLSTLQTLARFLVQLVGQSQAHQLLTAQSAQKYLDAFGQHQELQLAYNLAYRHYRDNQDQLEDLIQKRKEAEEEADFYQFQFQELAHAHLKIGEEEELFEERGRLAHAAKLQDAAKMAEDVLYSSQHSVLGALHRIDQSLKRVEEFDTKLAGQREKLTEIRFELEEVSRFFQDYGSRVALDPARLNVLEERLDLLQKIKKKHGGSLEGALQKMNDLKMKLSLIEDFESRQETLERQGAECKRQLEAAAQALSAARKSSASVLGKKMEELLKELAMPSVCFEVRVCEKESFLPTGKDAVEFWIAANLGEAAKPLAEVASGGEVSRVHLALESLIKQHDALKTFVFDEIDTGIGGATAAKVGEKLKKMSENSQIICVTHLPQIAAFADRHWFIQKETKDQRTYSTVRLLLEKEQEEEIARMLAGTTVTEAARLQARQLLGQCGASCAG